ncbi:carboxymuconolactone decarboxylase family protein [Agrobacterium sp. T29]|uniref:carboxymuconolactone decarboxylase family protein n=1 Tax=Agrobacterium sp. T29 TaxID=2580515 RepID=UPI00115DCFEC|nr:carboxymuconolactone decarboxylase family protein [Agrobacterium sp. T29]
MRLAPPDPNHFTTEQRRVHDVIASGPRGRVRGPLALWLHRPELAEAGQKLGQYCRYGSSLPPRLAEIAVLALVRLWDSELPWYAHKTEALKAGVEPEIIEAIRNGMQPDFPDAEASLVYQVVQEITNDRKISDKVYDDAVADLGKDAMVDLVAITGYYTFVAMTVNIFELPLPEGVEPEFSR